MKDLDAVACEFQRLHRLRVAAFHRVIDLSRGDAQAARIDIKAIKLPGRFDQRQIASYGHILDDGPGRAFDIGRHLALHGEKLRKSFGEIGAASDETNGHGGFPAEVLYLKAPLLNGAATNRRQPFAFQE